MPPPAAAPWAAPAGQAEAGMHPDHVLPAGARQLGAAAGGVPCLFAPTTCKFEDAIGNVYRFKTRVQRWGRARLAVLTTAVCKSKARAHTVRGTCQRRRAGMQRPHASRPRSAAQTEPKRTPPRRKGRYPVLLSSAFPPAAWYAPRLLPVWAGYPFGDISYWVALVFTLGCVAWVVNGHYALYPDFAVAARGGGAAAAAMAVSVSALVGGELRTAGAPVAPRAAPCADIAPVSSDPAPGASCFPPTACSALTSLHPFRTLNPPGTLFEVGSWLLYWEALNAEPKVVVGKTLLPAGGAAAAAAEPAVPAPAAAVLQSRSGAIVLVSRAGGAAAARRRALVLSSALDGAAGARDGAARAPAGADGGGEWPGDEEGHPLLWPTPNVRPEWIQEEEQRDEEWRRRQDARRRARPAGAPAAAPAGPERLGPQPPTADGAAAAVNGTPALLGAAPARGAAAGAGAAGRKRWRWFGLRLHDMGFAASFLQLIGATVFWVGGSKALWPDV